MARVISVRGEDAVAARLRGIAGRAKDVSAAWPSVGRMLSSRVNRQFMSNGREFGTPWRPLKPEYKLWKLRNGGGNKMLVWSGEMKRSFTSRPMSIELYGPRSATFGSTNQKAIWQHYGTRRNGKRVIPPRRILVLNRELRGDIRDKVADYIMRKGL